MHDSVKEMDNVRMRPRGQSSRVSQRQAASLAGSRAQGQPTKRRPRHQAESYWLLRTLGRSASTRKRNLWRRIKDSEFVRWPDRGIRQRVYTLLTLLLLIISIIAAAIQPFLEAKPYNISTMLRSVMPDPNKNLADYLEFNAKDAKFLYNSGYKATASPEVAKTGNGAPRITAEFNQDPAKGITVTDPVNQTDITLKPKFSLRQGKQDQNQLIYQLGRDNGYLVYTAQIASIKEDIVLESSSKDRLEFDYELALADGLDAKLEEDGSVGVYGTDLPINGNVSTGNDKDAELLQKVRQNAPKTKFLFGIPAPVVKETGKEESSVTSYFELEGNNLRVVSTGLKKASYPLTIDPSVYVQSAAQLMRGNNESNVAFDVNNELFKKGSTTGARIDEWTETGAMNDATYDQGVAAAGGYMYRAGGRSGRIMPWVASQKETALATASTTFVMDMPTVRPSGDLYLAIIAHDVNGTVGFSSVPAGWTLLADTREHAVYWHTGGGSEPATYSWTKNGNAVLWAGVILRIKNANATFTTATQNNAVDANPGFPTATPTSQGALVLRSASWDDDIVDDHGYAPTSHDEVASGMSGGTTGVSFAVSRLDSPPLSGVATGTATMPTGQNISDSYGASTIAVYGSAATPAYDQTLQWAHFNSTDGSIDSPTPGSSGSPCSGWCTNSVYNLPLNVASTSDGAGNVGMSLITYNGYLYAMGGYDGTNLKSTVYIAKLGANGEPSLWHPTDPNQANWVYWHKDTGLSGATARAYHAAYAYNGKMYILGGRTSMSGNGGGVTTVQLADILPNGALGTWSSGTALPEARWGLSVQAYNGYLYILGGGNSGTLLNTVWYNHLTSSGTMNATWLQATSFTTGRESHGGIMSGIWGGYIYLAGGCTTVNATGTGYCSAIASDVQLASISADGSLNVWNTMANLDNTRFGSSFIAWQDNLYRFGGCSRQDTTTGDCYAAHLDIQYGTINQDGDASTVSVTSASGSGLCTGADPYDCNLPPIGDGAGQGGQLLTNTAILNGYLYIIGGCASLACDTGVDVSGNVSYVAISSDGKLKRPPSCEYSSYGTWCVDDVNTVNGDTGVAASGIAIFGGNIYVVGGLNGAGNVANIYRNTTNNDGSLAGAWAAQTFAAAGVTLNLAYTFAYARANPVSAGTYPGNLYIFGGCDETVGAGCADSNTSGDQYRTEVYKCNILTTGALETADANDCDTANQLQIDSDAGTGGNQGLGIHAGTVYANYIYLLGGLNPIQNDLNEVRYAQFDNSNNVVAVSGGVWIESSVTMNVGRRRGTAFGYNGYLYAVGGFEGTGGIVLDTIEYVKLDVTDGSLIGVGGKFTRSAVTITQRWGLGLAVSNSYAYIIGGCNAGLSPAGCSSLDPTIQTFQVYNNDSGAPGGYTTSANQFATNRLGASAAVLNGYMYIAGGCISVTDCTQATNQSQYAPIDANGVVGTWTDTTGTFPEFRVYGQLEAVGNTLYYIGGQGNSGVQKLTVYWGTPGGGGDVTSFVAATKQLGDTGSGATERTQLSAAVWNNRIYVTGGVGPVATPVATNTVFVSPDLSAGGDIASNWTSTTAFNVARSGHVAVAYANNLYILGGYDGTNYLSDVQFAQIASNGTVGAWKYTTSLPTPLRQADGFASNGYMYMFGGRSSTNDCTERTLVAPISANTTIASGNNPTGIGEWYQTNRNYDGGRYGAAAVAYQGKAYVLGGGCQGIVMQDDFDATHDAAEWSYTTNMSADTVCQSTSTTNTFRAIDGVDTTTYAATKDVDVTSGGTILFKLFIPDGTNDGSCLEPDPPGTFSSVTEDVRLQYDTNDNWATVEGTIATYAYNQYDPLTRISVTIPVGAQTASTRFRWVYDPDAEAGDMFAIEDVSIVATGSTTISYASSSRVTQTSLLSQPQVANYSRLIDAGHDVFPTVWLLNGLDNSIGARWQMNYRSMNDPTVTDANKACGGSAMSAFGQHTNFGNVTLGQPGAYTVKNSGGTNISCSRYFFLNVSIDASQTYGYPDDVTRGPTLTDLTLFFKANPGQRLLHGKTFIEGNQQPLDTQCGISNPVDTLDVCPNQ